MLKGEWRKRRNWETVLSEVQVFSKRDALMSLRRDVLGKLWAGGGAVLGTFHACRWNYRVIFYRIRQTMLPNEPRDRFEKFSKVNVYVLATIHCSNPRKPIFWLRSNNVTSPNLTTCAGNRLRTITSDQIVYNNSSLSFSTRRYDIIE